MSVRAVRAAVTSYGVTSHGRVLPGLVLLGLWASAAYLLKRHYSTAAAGELTWILGPTAALVQQVTGAVFAFEAGVGYVSAGLGTAIVTGCAGVNFLVAALLTLFAASALHPRWVHGALFALPLAYVATVVVNATRILIDIATRQHAVFGLSHADQHRYLGVAIYMAALLGLFQLGSGVLATRHWQRLSIPVACYLFVGIVMPWLNGVSGAAFLRHSVQVTLAATAVAIAMAVAGPAVRLWVGGVVGVLARLFGQGLTRLRGVRRAGTAAPALASSACGNNDALTVKPRPEGL